jgi:hypothetical protein
MHAFPAAVLAALSLCFASPLIAQDIRAERVAFPAGASDTMIEDSITGRESVSYMLGASAGQMMSVRLTSANTSAYFNIYEPGRGPGDEAFAVSEMTGPMVPEMNRFEGVLPASGNYIVSVYLYRNAARAGETANYTLEISLDGASAAAAVPQGDFADGLSGGPDFWEVTGLSGNGSLNLRAGPSTSDAIVTRLGNGARLQNLGCKKVAGQRWCNVAMAADTAVSGWVTGQYLRESGATEASSTDALVPGTNYNATASVECSLRVFPGTTECPAGVTRGGPSIATVFITRPDGFDRVIEFADGDVRPMSGVTSFDWSKSGEETTVTVDREETYVIVDAFVFGG